MLHSDQEPQYISKIFHNLLRMDETIQFSKPGRPHDNDLIESFFASMKRETICHTLNKSEHQFIKYIDTYIKFGNTR